MVLARALILPAMFVPRSWKAATQARATSAAATAYSDSSSPVSSFKNLLSIWLSPLDTDAVAQHTCVARPLNDFRLLDGVGEGVDLASNVGAQQLESGDASQ